MGWMVFSLWADNAAVYVEMSLPLDFPHVPGSYSGILGQPHCSQGSSRSWNATFQQPNWEC
jgi:hypothetical protein